MSEPLNKGDLVKVFHREMIDLAQKRVALFEAVRQAVRDGCSEEDIDAGTSPEGRILFGMHIEWTAQLEDVKRRLEEAQIGDWMKHFDDCGALKIISDFLNRKPPSP